MQIPRPSSPSRQILVLLLLLLLLELCNRDAQRRCSSPTFTADESLMPGRDLDDDDVGEWREIKVSQNNFLRTAAVGEEMRRARGRVNTAM